MPKNTSKKRRISDETVIETIIQLCAAAYPDQPVRPEDVAITIYPEDWQSLLKRIRLTARQLAEMGYVDILRKGKRVDPDDFKGVYRLALTDAFFTLPVEQSDTD